MDGLYYLHTNGELIYRPHGDVADMRDSDFVRTFWSINPSDRESAWTLLVEAAALGAKPERIKNLAEKWRCTDEDAKHYAERIKATLTQDGDKVMATRHDFVNLQESPAGFGDTALEALAELAKDLGYKASKMWGASFKQLLSA